MKCRSCQCEIPPAFVTAIANNSCPGCGGQIMSEVDQELMTSLAEAMERMPNDPQGLAGWLLSNYTLRKVGTAEPVERFYRPVKERKEENSEDKSKFAERSGYKPKEDLAAKVKALKNKAQTAPLAQAIEEAEMEEEDIEVSEDDDLAALEEFKQKLPGRKPSKSGGIITAAELKNMIKKGNSQAVFEDMQQDSFEDDYENEEPGGYRTEQELALMGTAEGRKVLDNDKFKRIKGQDAIRSGGGSFRR